MSDERTGLSKPQAGEEAESGDDLQAKINGILTDATEAMNAWKGQFDAQRQADDSPEGGKPPPNIITEQLTLETRNDLKLFRTEQEEPDNTGSGDGDDDPDDEGPPGDDDGPPPECTCEEMDEEAQAAGCTGTAIRHYCNRFIKATFSSDGEELVLDIIASGDGGDPADGFGCDPAGEGDWWFIPTEEQVLAWLASMDMPPPNLMNPDGFSYQVTMFFDCSRGFTPDPDTGSDVPCGDETSSQVQLIGICWRT